MTTFARHVNSIKEKFVRLCDELFCFLSLIILTCVEALFLFVFVSVHAYAHDYLDNSPLCPLKITIFIMGMSFLLLTLVIVVALVTDRTVETVRNLRSSIKKPPDQT